MHAHVAFLHVGVARGEEGTIRVDTPTINQPTHAPFPNAGGSHARAPPADTSSSAVACITIPLVLLWGVCGMRGVPLPPPREESMLLLPLFFFFFLKVRGVRARAWTRASAHRHTHMCIPKK